MEAKLRAQFAADQASTIAAERERIKKEEEQKTEFRVIEKDLMINQLSEQVKNMQKQIEQGSTQVQGEVMEIAIEDWLTENFKNLDEIIEIKKGQRGADCLHMVYSPKDHIRYILFKRFNH